MAARPCPCSSGEPYASCCGPYHRGALPVPDAPTLVRARYSAFALGEIGFLYGTLHDGHPDRQKPEERVLAALRAASGSFKYMGLRLFDVKAKDEHGAARVLYRARIFRRGTDVSFIELAEFADQDGAPRYLAGTTIDAAGSSDTLTMTFDDFARAALARA